jgi:hypothetical protein
MTEPSKPAAPKEEPKETKTPVPVAKPASVAPPVPTAHVPHPITNAIPDGAIDPNELRPGYGPLEGSPKENDPTQLANPNNPNSPITKPQNPSNPANMPQTQSEKPPSEVAKMVTTPPLVADPQFAEKSSLLAKIGQFLKDAGGNESAIAPNSEYWAAVARYRLLMNP